MLYEAIAFVRARAPDNLKENLGQVPGVKKVLEILGQADSFVVEIATKELLDLYRAREQIKSLSSVQDCILEIKL